MFSLFSKYFLTCLHLFVPISIKFTYRLTSIYTFYIEIISKHTLTYDTIDIDNKSRLWNPRSSWKYDVIILNNVFIQIFPNILWSICMLSFLNWLTNNIWLVCYCKLEWDYKCSRTIPLYSTAHTWIHILLMVNELIKIKHMYIYTTSTSLTHVHYNVYLHVCD